MAVAPPFDHGVTWSASIPLNFQMRFAQNLLTFLAAAHVGFQLLERRFHGVGELVVLRALGA